MQGVVRGGPRHRGGPLGAGGADGGAGRQVQLHTRVPPRRDRGGVRGLLPRGAEACVPLCAPHLARRGRLLQPPPPARLLQPRRRRDGLQVAALQHGERGVREAGGGQLQRRRLRTRLRPRAHAHPHAHRVACAHGQHLLPLQHALPLHRDFPHPPRPQGDPSVAAQRGLHPVPLLHVRAALPVLVLHPARPRTQACAGGDAAPGVQRAPRARAGVARGDRRGHAGGAAAGGPGGAGAGGVARALRGPRQVGRPRRLRRHGAALGPHPQAQGAAEHARPLPRVPPPHPPRPGCDSALRQPGGADAHALHGGGPDPRREHQ
mmetsp:Transcript_23124/g.48450  ORF Transcript_23124/g.48450 Transcript_23124/m.48450 type:complete len:320 (-) Transcript_23124:1653-2612(-)